MVRKQDQIHGCLLGAAAGDALGFCVEELTLDDIREKYGPNGIQVYDTINGFATISSHTQLCMFTANGLLFGATRGAIRGVMAPYVKYLEAAYRDWCKTQHYGVPKGREKSFSWLSSVDAMRSRRCPEPAVLYALERPQAGTMEEPINHSRGPNGLARCVPIGLFFHPSETPLPEISLQARNPPRLPMEIRWVFSPAAYLTNLLSRILYGEPDSFRSILHKTRENMIRQFSSRFSQIRAIETLLNWAEHTAEAPTSPCRSVVPAAAYRCCIHSGRRMLSLLKIPGRLRPGHCGGGQSLRLELGAGRCNGALLGAQVGTEGIPDFYLEPLELRNLIEELANDLFQGCPMSRNARLLTINGIKNIFSALIENEKGSLLQEPRGIMQQASFFSFCVVPACTEASTSSRDPFKDSYISSDTLPT